MLVNLAVTGAPVHQYTAWQWVGWVGIVLITAVVAVAVWRWARRNRKGTT